MQRLQLIIEKIISSDKIPHPPFVRINISNFSEIINITEDGLYEIAHRVTNLWCTSANIDIEDYNYGLSPRYLWSVDAIPISLNFIDSSGNPINNINLYSFYSPQNLDMSSLISI